MTAAKLVPLLLLVGVGLWSVRPEFLRMAAPTASQVGDTAIVLLFAFLGIEVALVPSGEVRDPARTVPRAVVLALAITTAMYLAIQGVAQGVLGPELATYADAPLAETARRLLGGAGRLLVLIGATVSMFGYVSGDMLGTPRALFALGRDGMLPAALARVHPRYHTPALAIVTYAVIVSAVSISGSFTQLAILSNVAALSLYLLCVVASAELQRRDVQMAGTPFSLPGGPLVPVFASVGILWLISHATRREFAIEAAVLVLASLYYVIRQRSGRPRPHASRA
jgi:amino acid transporter